MTIKSVLVSINDKPVLGNLHSKKNPVAWYCKLRNELRCFSKYLQEPTTRCMAQLVLFF